MRPQASTARRSTRTPLRRTVAATVVLLSLLCLPIANALHYHRKHRRHHRHGQHSTNNASNISQPPDALPPDVGGDSPTEPPALPPDVDHAPPRSSRHDKPCTPSNPPSRAKAFSPVGAPIRSPAPAKPPALSPAQPPSHSHAKPPALPPAGPPAIPSAKQPSVSPAEPPALPPDVDHAPPRSSRHDKPCTPSNPPSRAQAFSPVGAPTRSPAPAKPPALSPAQPPSHSHAKPPALPPVGPPAIPSAKPPSVSPARPPSLSPTKAPPASFSPSMPPSTLTPSHAEPPPCAPAKPPLAGPPPLSPAKPPAPAPAQPPRLSPAKPPPHAPAPKPPTPPPPAIPPVAAKPPALPPATTKAKPPSSIPPATAPTAKNSSAACSNVFDVRAFGATGNGSYDDTRAFRAAWKAACSAESATLLLPSDGVFTVTSTIFSGPCKPGLTFQIDGVLMPPDGPASWPAADSRRQWIIFYKTDGMTLTGRGTIEGNGEDWWNLPCKPHRGPNGSTLPGPCDSPALIRFLLSSNVTVEGLRIENSPQFHLKFDGCDRVRVDGLFVSSPSFSPNTDGIHVENTTSVEIYNSRINNGDDCISIGAGCSNVHIENVTCVHGHGISIGSLGVHNTRACVSNITVRNARILNSDNGVRIKTWQGGAGSVRAVEFAGVRMDNVKNCIVIDQYYCLGSGCANQTSAVRVAGVTYRDIRGTYNPQAGPPVRFACSDSVACTDITMTDVELLPADGRGSGVALLADPYCWNAYGVMETLTLPPVSCLREGRPDSLQDQLSSC